MSSSPPATTEAAATPPELSLPSSSQAISASLNDFPDWLSPALVKDLRRGLKMRGFILTFLALVVALTVLSAGIMLWEADSEAISIIWFPIGLVLMLIQPLRGLNAISEERKLETLPLIQLTRLSSFKILLGKWTALAFQTGLISVALLPYFVLGHFMGGFEFILNVLVLVGITFLSLLLTALMVATSVIPNMVVRILIALGTLIPFFYATLASLVIMIFEEGIEVADLAWIVLGVCLVSSFLIYYFLSAGGSQLAIPGSENHSTLRRLVALGVVLILSAICWILPTQEKQISLSVLEPVVATSLYFMLAIALVVIVDCLVDPAGTSVRTVKQFRHLPKFISFLFAPGWPFGWMFVIFFAALVMFGSASGFQFTESTDENELTIYLFILANIVGAFLWPAALAVLVPKFRMRPMLRFVIYFLAFNLLAMIIGLLSSLGDSSSLLVIHPMTNSIFLGEEYDYGAEISEVLFSLVFTFVHVIAPSILLFICADSLRHRFRLQIEAAKNLDENLDEMEISQETIAARAEEDEF